MELFKGRCQRGKHRFRDVGETVALFVCHCTECQRQSSSAFGMALWLRTFTREATGQDAGVTPWMDKPPAPYELDGIPLGGDWESHVRERLRNASRVLVFLSSMQFGLKALAWADALVRAKVEMAGQATPIPMSAFVRLVEGGARILFRGRPAPHRRLPNCTLGGRILLIAPERETSASTTDTGSFQCTL